MEFSHTPLLPSLEKLPGDYAWREGLLLLANCLAVRLRVAAGGKPDEVPDYDRYHRVLDQLNDYFGYILDQGADFPQDPEKYDDWSLFFPDPESLSQPLTELPAAAQLVVLLALAPHLWPGFLDQLVQEYLPEGMELPEFGGVRGSTHRGLLPTGETALFLLTGPDLHRQTAARRVVFGPGQALARRGLLRLAEVPPGEPRFSGRLLLDEHTLERCTTGRYVGPQFGPDFPAQQLSTNLAWEDLVLAPRTRTLVDDITNWLVYQEELRTDWGLDRHLKPGYRVLFYGPSGTGKTLTAALLGKFTGREVYRVDLSLVTSKYIGETEKNLGRLFDRAHAQGWILFFDEADALFGKRTETQDAHDRFANQEVAYLLQKVEDYDGLVILATNLKDNIDAAFSRRFQAMVPFALPTAAERLTLWQQTLPDRRAKDVQPEQLAARYELSGATILNVVQFAILRTLGRGKEEQRDIQLPDIIEGIRLEYQKEGKLL